MFELKPLPLWRILDVFFDLEDGVFEILTGSVEVFCAVQVAVEGGA